MTTDFETKLQNCEPHTYDTEKYLSYSCCFNNFFDAYKCRSILVALLPNNRVEVYKKTGKNGTFYSCVVYLDKEVK